MAWVALPETVVVVAQVVAEAPGRRTREANTRKREPIAKWWLTMAKGGAVEGLGEEY